MGLIDSQVHSMRTRIKICGITRPDDALAAAALGADAIGLVFYAKSPRAVSISQAQLICKVLPPFVTTVALFVDAEPAEIQAVVDTLPIDVLQFHGQEDEFACLGYGRPYIKAVRMHDDVQLADVLTLYDSAQAILVDAYSAAAAGGTGEVFDWSRVPNGLDTPIILAGGLAAENVSEAIITVNPYAVDVSSGVEADKGIKDTAKLKAFISAVTRTDAQR